MRIELKRHLYLIGYRGTGKSSVGRILAQNLSLPLIDSDDQIESDAAMTIREIFATGGETRFRDLESEAVARISRGPTSVVSLGGGAVLRERNREMIADTGWCVWLDADAETLAARIAGDAATADRRPALTELPAVEEIRQLLSDRQPIYQQSASLRVATEQQSTERIAEQVAAWFRSLRETDGPLPASSSCE